LIRSNTKDREYLSNFPDLSHHYYLKQLLTPEIYQKYYNIKTKESYSLDDVIQSGLDNPSEQKNCLVVPSKDAYYKYNDLFLNYLKMNFPQEDFTKKFENESYGMVKSLMMGMQEIIEKYFVEVDFISNRNIENFNFTSKINRSERKSVKNILESAIKNLEMEVFKSEGLFSPVRNKYDNDILLYSAGVFRDWPNDRMIYLNNPSRLICLINEEDHLKVKLNSVDSKEMTNAILNYFEFLEKMESKVNFVIHEKFGFLNSQPVNSGTGTYFALKIKISSDQERHKDMLQKMEESKKDLYIEITQQDGQYYLNLSNSNPFYTFSTLLIELLNIKDYFK
jgi:creatine kinase